MADFVSTAISAIETTLLALYAKTERSLSQKDRAIVFAEISRLEESRRRLLSEQARTSTDTATMRPRCVTVDLQTGPASSSEGE